MKLNGIFGKGSGKVGSSVFAVSGGEQIVRQYNPNVSNPSTDAQVEQRAKLKLMSQIAAALASIIAIPKKGLVSARNRFVSLNIGLCEFNGNEATCTIGGLQLTEGSQFISAPVVIRGADATASVHIDTGFENTFDKVLYASVEETENNKLHVLGTALAEPGANQNFAATVKQSSNPFYVFAYGVKFNGNAAKVRYGDYVTLGVNEQAALEISVADLVMNATLSKTECTQVAAQG